VSSLRCDGGGDYLQDDMRLSCSLVNTTVLVVSDSKQDNKQDSAQLGLSECVMEFTTSQHNVLLDICSSRYFSKITCTFSSVSYPDSSNLTPKSPFRSLTLICFAFDSIPLRSIGPLVSFPFASCSP
jgi:hypothetical protein